MDMMRGAQTNKGKKRTAERLIGLFIVSILFLSEIGFAIYLIQSKDKYTSLDLETVLIAAQQIPLSSGFPTERGIIVPTRTSIVTVKDVSMDLSNLNEGYIFVRYDGSRDKMVLTVASVDRDAVVHNDRSTNQGLQPYYAYPVGSGWQGYALPYGSGTYTIRCLPYDEGNQISLTEEISKFNFSAYFNEDAPYKYSNVYSNIEANDTAVAVASYLILQQEKAKKRALTDKEKTELIIPYIREHIKEDTELQAQAELYENSPYKFPDTEDAMNTGIGNCNERSALAAIMLKSQQIPVKIFHGYVRIKNDSDKDSIRRYHAWIDVYLDGGWVMYDPTSFDKEVPSIVDNGFADYLLDTAIVR
ncbi:MAG: transglutaminase-like domain-containing protein [Clostridiales Family XIII bacterium]|jgi:hypothetical protein|nr:transglutaminase-like domain-containing protein [Clostridiales Family XIII bacterium]